MISNVCWIIQIYLYLCAMKILRKLFEIVAYLTAIAVCLFALVGIFVSLRGILSVL